MMEGWRVCSIFRCSQTMVPLTSWNKLASLAISSLGLSLVRAPRGRRIGDTDEVAPYDFTV